MLNKTLKITKLTIATLTICGSANIFASNDVSQAFSDISKALTLSSNSGDDAAQSVVETNIVPALKGATSVSSSDPSHASSSDSDNKSPPKESDVDKQSKQIVEDFDDASGGSLGAGLADNAGVHQTKKPMCYIGNCSSKDNGAANSTIKAMMLNFGGYMADGADSKYSLLNKVITSHASKSSVENYEKARKLYIRFLNAGYNTPQLGVDTSKLSKDDDVKKITSSPDYNKLKATTYTMQTRGSIANSNMLYVLDNQLDSAVVQGAAKIIANPSNEIDLKQVGSSGDDVKTTNTLLRELIGLQEASMRLAAIRLNEEANINDGINRMLASSSASLYQTAGITSAGAKGTQAKVIQAINKLKQQEDKDDKKKSKKKDSKDGGMSSDDQATLDKYTHGKFSKNSGSNSDDSDDS